MIPKKIHYCWFGRAEKPKLAQKCIESWKKYCPDYEIIEWNEDNFNVNTNAYTMMCYEQKKYAFLTDYLRLLIIYEHGGIYFDTDVETIKSFDGLLDNHAFVGFENNEYVATGLGFGAEPNNAVIKQMLSEYDSLLDGKNGTIGCPILNTNALLKFGLKQDGAFQNLEYATVYPTDYFNPYDAPTGRLKKTENTYSVHWYSGSWLTPKQRIRSAIGRPLHRIFGTDFFRKNKK